LRHGVRAARRTELMVWRPRPIDPDDGYDPDEE
jgi:hypothetical protein